MLGNHVGWKCGACSPAAQAGMQLSEPFRAPLFQQRIFTDPRTVIDSSKVNLTLLEAEFGLVMSKSLPPRGASNPYTAAEVMDAVSVVIPCVEVCASRWSGAAFEQSTSFHRLADGGGNESCLTGDAIATEGSPIMQGLDSVGVRFLINGEEVPPVEEEDEEEEEEGDPGAAAAVVGASGSGANVLGHPAAALAWLANSLIEGQTSTEASKYGGGAVIGLAEGDFVMSGAAAILPAGKLKPGDVVVAEFGAGMGSVELVIGPDAAAAAAEGQGQAEEDEERMSNEAWRDMCAEARARSADGSLGAGLGGMIRVPMIYPWSAAREAALREALAAAAAAAKL
jgi:2-keto-4-pentenoate hydratase